MNQKNYSFRDAKLHSLPLQLLNGVGAASAQLGWRWPALTPELPQQGEEIRDDDAAAVHEALQRYVDAAEHEANLNTLGRIAVRNMLSNALRNRRSVLAWLAKNPQANAEEIRQPWVVIGLPRTGTSLLCSLLGLDPSCRPLLQWEAARPMPPANIATAYEDERIAAFNKDMGRAVKLNPTLPAMHPFGAMLAEECTAVFMYALRTIGMEAIAFVPTYGKWLDNADMLSAYRIHKRTLQALQYAQPTERWVLKSPNHLWSLDALLATYPDARIVWIHRNPADVVTSLASINNAMQLPFARHHDAPRVAEYWAEKVAVGIAKASAFDAAAPSHWCCHVHYNDLMADTPATIETIYRHFDSEVQPLHRRRMHAWLQYRPQHAFGKHVYDPSDFGWTQGQLEARYRDYRQRYCDRSSA